MSEQPAAGKAPGKKYAGLSRNQWFLVGGVFVAAVAYILWRRHQAAAKTATTASTTTSTSTSTAAQLAAIEDALSQLEGQGYSGGGAGGGGYYGGGGTGTVATSTAAATKTVATSTAAATGTPTSTAGTTSSGPAATAAPAAAKTAGAISNLQASSVTSSSFKVTWNKAANATGYAYRVMLAKDYPNGPLVKSGTVTGTSVTVSGLKSKSEYNFGIQALPGGAGNNIHVTTS